MFDDLAQILLTITVSLGSIFALLFLLARLEPRGSHRAAGQPSVRAATDEATASHRLRATRDE